MTGGECCVIGGPYAAFLMIRAGDWAGVVAALLFSSLATLVVDTLELAIARCKPAPGLVQVACDNALAESFIATSETELLCRDSWPTRQITRIGIFEHIEGFYDGIRRHPALGHLSPVEFGVVDWEKRALRGGEVPNVLGQVQYVYASMVR